MKHILISLVISLSAFSGATAQDVIDIVYSSGLAKVTIPSNVTDVTYTVEGAHVVVNSGTTSREYTYRLSGSSSNGSFTLNGSYKLTLQLAGVKLTSIKGAAIDIECGKRIAVELVDGTENTLVDKVDGTQKAALYFKGHPEFKGGGTLNVTGRTKHAIAAKEYIELKKSTGFINVLGAVSDGIHCGKGIPDAEKNYFLMQGGTVNMQSVQGDGIDADDYGTVRIEGGALSINLGADATGLDADSIVAISGGAVNISIDGADSEAIRACHSVNISGGSINVLVNGDGSKGIKAKKAEGDATVVDGGLLAISGGTTSIEVAGGNFTDADGEQNRCMAVSVDANMTQTGGSVSLTAMGPQASTFNVKGTDDRRAGEWLAIRTPWVVNARNYQYDMSVYAVVEDEDGQRLNAYDQVAVGAFQADDCVGYGVFQTTAYGVLRIHSNSVEATPISFRLYNYAADGTITELEVNQTVVFAPDALVGSPSTPLVLKMKKEEQNAINDVLRSPVFNERKTINVNGQRIGSARRGIIIERSADGTVRKIISDKK
ncbi:MAG: carbohydrate-binding domain-containing protein [Prevotella sp.]|nr:carbohydrate-binding domain-containing protein [Prevotella sp.]